MTTVGTLAQRAFMHEWEYEVERVVLNALATGMRLRRLIACAFGDLALPSSSEKPIHLWPGTRCPERAANQAPLTSQARLDIALRAEQQRSA
jgi:hypothetical protein